MYHWIIALLALFGLWIAIRWFVRTPARDVVKRLKKSAFIVITLLLIVMALTGRLHWLLALIGAFLAAISRMLPMLIRFAPMLLGLWKRWQPQHSTRSSKRSEGDTSTVEARFVRMTLDHTSGEMEGQVLEGEYRGKALQELRLDQLIRLYQTCVDDDNESAALLEAYLDRVHGVDWRTQQDAGNGEGASNETTARSDRQMGRDEAYQILGLQPNASHAEIIEAHRKLMQKVHPDRGGSDYLAAKINQAKDYLLQ